MNPNEVSAYLNRIASAIDRSDHPSRSLVASDLFRIILATDKSFSIEIRANLIKEIMKMLPGVFNGELWDTHIGGKGFSGGYISFGMDPLPWDKEGIIGGILFRMIYSGFVSENPDKGPWPGRKDGGAYINFDVEAGYYSHRGSQGYQVMTEDDVKDSANSPLKTRYLGEVDVMVDNMEIVDTLQVLDPGKFKGGIEYVVNEILRDPLAIAQGTAWKKKRQAPNTSQVSLLKWLVENNRTDVKQSEINAVARTQCARNPDKIFGVVERSISEFFRNRNFAIDTRG
jgi:hypothetical protein